MPGNYRPPISKRCHQVQVIIDANNGSRAGCLHSKQSFCIPGILFKLLAVFSWPTIFWRMWHCCTTRYDCVYFSFTWIEACFGYLLAHHSIIARKNQTRNKSINRRVHYIRQNRTSATQILENIFQDIQHTQPISVSKKACALHKGSEMVWSYYKQWLL